MDAVLNAPHPPFCGRCAEAERLEAQALALRTDAGTVAGIGAA